MKEGNPPNGRHPSAAPQAVLRIEKVKTEEKGGIMYNYDSLWRTMKERGVTTYSLINHYNISSHTMSNIRHNENITVETLHKLCQILHCQASDVVEITFDEGEDVFYREVKEKAKNKR